MHLDKKDIEIKAKPFRCEEFWFHILGFIEVVKEAWSTNFMGFNAFQLVKKIQVFSQKVKAWNKYEVKNLEANIKQIQKEINVVQGILMTYPHNVFLQERNVSLSQRLNQIMKLEEIKWAQKLRQAWTC